jgi:protease-4
MAHEYSLPPPMPSRSTILRCVALLLLAGTHGCVLITADLNPFSRRPQPLEERQVSGSGAKKVLLMDISGVITSEERDDAIGLRTNESTVARVEAELEQAADDDKIIAIVLRINSPGGTVTGSDIIYDRLMRFKAEYGVPVLVQMMDVAASGGYYAALAGDQIVASPTTVTGSIGVIFTSVSVEGLLDKIGVQNQTVVSGKMKDIGSPLRTMTPAERRVLDALVGDMYQRFVGLVRERRPHLTDEMQAQMVDGRVFSAQQALVGGLVDDIGYLDGTLELAKLRAGVREARVIRYRRPDEFADSLYSHTSVGPPQVNLFNVNFESLSRTPSFLYLWAP